MTLTLDDPKSLFMDQPLYDIYFTGNLVEGADLQAAQASFAKMFKASPDAVAKFFNGKPQILKRGVDKPEALKYKAALHQAGMIVAFKAHQSESAQPTDAVASTSTPNTSPNTTTNATTDPAATDSAHSTAAAVPPNRVEEDWSLAPAGSDVLKAHERKTTPVQNIDTSAIKMVSAFANTEPEPKEIPPPPNTNHISVAPVGEDLLIDKPEAPAPLPFDLDAITLAPPGSDLEELRPNLPPVNPDISGLSMAEVGADILEGQPKREPPPAPNTDHLTITKP